MAPKISFYDTQNCFYDKQMKLPFTTINSPFTGTASKNQRNMRNFFYFSFLSGIVDLRIISFIFRVEQKILDTRTKRKPSYFFCTSRKGSFNGLLHPSNPKCPGAAKGTTTWWNLKGETLVGIRLNQRGEGGRGCHWGLGFGMERMREEAC